MRRISSLDRIDSFDIEFEAITKKLDSEDRNENKKTLHKGRVLPL